MKKLGKLNLKSEKMLNHEELVSFRGGSNGTCIELTVAVVEACHNTCYGNGEDYVYCMGCCYGVVCGWSCT